MHGFHDSFMTKCSKMIGNGLLEGGCLDEIEVVLQKSESERAVVDCMSISCLCSSSSSSSNQMKIQIKNMN